MTGPGVHAFCKQFAGAMQVDEPHIPTASMQTVSIGLFQSGTGDDSVPCIFLGFSCKLRDRVKPRPAILINQRNALGHFGSIGRRVKIVAVAKGPTKLRRNGAADGGFAGSRHSHDHENHGERLTGSDLGRRDGMSGKRRCQKRSFPDFF